MKAVIYCRTSTDKQAKEESIQTQIAKLKEIIKNPVKEYLDDGYSESDMYRPSLAQMMEDAGNKIFDTLYIYALDRLSRDGVRQKIILGSLQKLGIRVFEQNKEIENTPDAQLMASIYAIISKAEKDKIRQRSTDGRRRSAKEGRYVSGGVAPYGYKRIRDYENKRSHLEIDEEKARIVNKIFDIFLKVKSCRMTAVELTKKGYPSPAGKNRWYERGVNFILRNTAYIGINYFNKRVRIESKASKEETNNITKENWIEKLLPSVISEKRTSWKYRDKTEWIPNEVPVIVNKDKFDEAQKILEFNHRKTQNKRAKSFYMLTGILRCSCGSPMCGDSHCSKTQKPYRSYRCADKQRKFPFKNYCKLGSVGADRIEKAVWNEVKKIIKDPNYVVGVRDNILNEHKKENIGSIEREINELEKRKIKLSEEKSRYAELYGRGGFSIDEIEELAEKTNEKIKEVEQEINEKKKQLEAKANIKNIERYAELISGQKTTDKYLDNLSPLDKKELIKKHVDKIIYFKDKDEIKLFGAIVIEKEIIEIASIKERLELFGIRVKLDKSVVSNDILTMETLMNMPKIKELPIAAQKEVKKEVDILIGKHFQLFEIKRKEEVSLSIASCETLGQVSFA